MASLMAGLVLPSSVHADEDLLSKYSGSDIRNVADDKIAEREGKVDLNNSSVHVVNVGNRYLGKKNGNVVPQGNREGL